ncbi:MAG TPA: hypothetical protein VGQ75_04100 [Thermoanaerobaculia bacterium]|nr:hypothetical protein [Thermoanaerobaculia bacterium]
MNRNCQSQLAPRLRTLARTAFALLAFFLLLASPVFAYVVKLKDGSLVFARAPYTVKGTRAIITLENGTVTQIELEKIDVPGTVKYNKENFGNVVALDTPQEKAFQLPTPARQSKNPLQDLIRQRRGQLGLPTPGRSASAAGSAAASSDGQTVDSVLQARFSRIFDGTGINQYRVTNYRGKTRLVATANSEQAVFNTLSASARAIVEAAEQGRASSVEIVLTTASGEPAGTFEMTPAQAKLLVDRSMTVQDYFIKNVIF